MHKRRPCGKAGFLQPRKCLRNPQFFSGYLTRWRTGIRRDEAALGGTVAAFLHGLRGGNVNDERRAAAAVGEAEDEDVRQRGALRAEVELVLNERLAGDCGEGDLISDAQREQIDRRGRAARAVWNFEIGRAHV